MTARKRDRAVKPVTGWGVRKPNGDLMGTWTSMGDGTEVITAAVFGLKKFARKFGDRCKNRALNLEPVPVLITPLKRGKQK